MKILVLGKTGFIGSALLAGLHSEHQVTGISSADIDLTKELSVDKLTHQLCPETTLVIAVRAPQNSPQNRDISIIKTICQALAIKPVRQCIYFSSISVYGETCSQNDITETTPTHPSSPYGTSRLEAENLLAAYTRKQNIPLLILRACMIYGPGNKEFPYGPDKFIRAIHKTSQIELFGCGEDLRDYLYIKDLVRITQNLIPIKQSGILNLVSGKSYSFNDITEILRDLSDKTFEVVHLPRKKLKINQSFDNSRLANIISNFTPLEKGLQETLQSHNSNRR